MLYRNLMCHTIIIIEKIFLKFYERMQQINIKACMYIIYEKDILLLYEHKNFYAQIFISTLPITIYIYM
jgi:hypothetical protein